MTTDKIGKLNKFFEKLPIDLVYLYGSRVNGHSDASSDYDIGIVFDENLSSNQRFDLRLGLFSKIANILDIDEEGIDVVDLEEVPILLQFNVISGKLIYCKDNDRKISFESFVMGRYADEHYYLDRYLIETLEKIKKGVYFERKLSYL